MHIIHINMYSIGQQAIKNINGSLDFVETNLKYQYVIPHYASGWASEEHNEIDGLTSTLKCSITIKNLAHNVPEKYVYTLSEMAEMIIYDYLQSDVDGDFDYDSKAQNILPPIKIFKIDYTHSASRTVEINSDTFEITVIYERKYMKRE